MRGLSNFGSGAFLLLVVAGILVSGCGDAPPTDPNRCGWPDYCQPISARDMMQAIRDRAEADEAKAAVDPMVLDRIRESFERITDPGLTNGAGRHVCVLDDPKPCDELARIHTKTLPENMPDDPKARRGRWETVATDLESFPTGK